MVDGINNIFKTGQKIELKDRGAKGSGITFELKSVFEELSKQGIIKDKDGKGLTKQDALNLYNTLNKIHQDTNRTTNYTTMQVGQSFDYSAEELKAMAEAAGYEIVAQGEEGAPANPDALDPSKDEPAGLPTETSISDEPLDKPQGNQRAQTEAMIDKLGGKIIERSVNGQKQDIAVVEIDGQTVRREINEDGTLGDKLAATKTFGKNEYISGDFPPETKVLEREVNGKKQQIGIYEDENGNKMRRLVEQDPNTGEYRLGDNLVAISTAGKNKYITQTEMDNRMRQALGLADNEAIPEDIKGEFVSIGGEPTLVFKQDGKVMDNAQLKEYVRGLQEQRVEKFDSQIAQFGAAEINDSEKLASAQFDVINNKYGDKQGNVNSDEYFNYEMSSTDKDALAQEGVTEDILREVSNFNFNVIDENGDGEITKDELKTYYDNANKNGDNIITADEITQYGSESMLNRMQPNIEKVVADGYEVQDFEGSPVFVKDGKTYWMNMDGTLGDIIGNDDISLSSSSPDAETSTTPIDQVKDIGVTDDVNDEEKVQKNNQDTVVVPQRISRNGLEGIYTLTSGADGSGYRLESKCFPGSNYEAREFFRDQGLLADDNHKIIKGKDGLYSFRGITGNTWGIVSKQATAIGQKISMNNAIYNDLLNKQKSGTELTEPEKAFIKDHLSNLEKYGLGLDSNGNLIDKL